MAVTSIWPIKGRVDNVINYACNPQKTFFSPLEDTAIYDINYDIAHSKSNTSAEERKFVTCLNCSEETAAQQFMNTKRLYSKLGGIQCYHGYQSFKENEVTAETAHQIGIQLAEKLWEDRFEVVVATHLNTGCYHNHFVINSVSFRDGYKFYNSKNDYAAMKAESDYLCQQHGLSIIKQTENTSKSYAERKAEKDGKQTVRDTIRNDIDRAVKASFTPEDFLYNIRALGYQIKTVDQNGNYLKYPSLKPIGAKGYYRFHKLGKEYELERVIDRVYSNRRYRDPLPDYQPPKNNNYGRLKGKFDNIPHKTGLYPMYMRYGYELARVKAYPTSTRRISQTMREDIIKMDNCMMQSETLGKYKIYTIDELNDTRNMLKDKVDELVDMRKALRNMVKRAERASDTARASELKEDIAGITLLLKHTRKEIKWLNQVEERSADVKENLRQIDYDRARDFTPERSASEQNKDYERNTR